MPAYLNSAQVALPVALYLATDNYDHVPGVLSATQIMKATRQQILTARVPAEQRSIDVMGLVKSRMGSSIHDGVERAWSNPTLRMLGLQSLGLDESIANRIVFNPEETLRGHGYEERSLKDLVMTEGPIAKDAIAVYMEIRGFRQIAGRWVSGKFDFVGESMPHDFKSTGTFTWTKGVKWEDYQIQLSIYKWLNPEIIQGDVGFIHFFFTDWKQWETQNPAYPTHPIMTKEIPLWSLQETEDYLNFKLNQFDLYKDSTEDLIPLCNDKELWRRDDVWKVYKDPANTKRAINGGGGFKDEGAAHVFNQEKTGGAGAVVKFPGQVNACKYCDAFSICSQKDSLIADGSLQFNN